MPLGDGSTNQDSIRFDQRSIGQREIRQDQEFLEYDDDDGIVRLQDGWDFTVQEDLSVVTDLGVGNDADITRNLNVGAALFLEGILAKTANYTVTDSDGWIINVTTGATDRTITLPTAADNTGRVITVRKVDSGAGDVIIDGEGSEQIDGSTTMTLVDEGSVVTLQCNGTSWDWIGGHILGSNPDGSYVVFSSELQVCWSLPMYQGSGTSTSDAFGATSGTVYYYDRPWTFPKAFSSAPAILCSGGTGIAVQAYWTSPSTTACILRAWHPSGSTFSSTYPMYGFAIGASG